MTAYQAKRLPSQPGPAGWNCILPAQTAPTVLGDAIRADVAIIGAGFAGLTAAWRLVQLDPGLRIVILEAGRIAEGPAGRNSGFMIDLPHDLASDSYAGKATESDRLQTDMNRVAIRYGAEIADELEMDRAVFDPCGKVNAAASDAGARQNRDYAAHLTRLREPHRILDARDMQELSGTNYFHSGLYTPGTVLLQPAAYVRALTAGLLARPRLPIQLFQNSAVRSLIDEKGGWRLTAGSGTVSAGRVIMATNGHAESFGFFRRRLLHVFTYASMTEPLPPGRLAGQASWGMTPADPMGTTLRRFQSADGDRILVRTCFTYDPSMQISDSRIAKAGRVHELKFADRFPGLSGVRMACSWGGQLCLSWNGVPAHGEIERNLFSAVCQNGLGTSKGTLAGMSAAELAFGTRSSVTDYMTSMAAPRRLPPGPLTTIGVNAALRIKEWRARSE